MFTVCIVKTFLIANNYNVCITVSQNMLWLLVLFPLSTYSLGGNNIGDAGTQALAEGLKGCANLQKLS